MDRSLRVAWLLLLAALAFEAVWLALGLGARDLVGPFLVAIAWMAAFGFAGRAWARRRGGDEKEGIVTGVGLYALLGVLQYLPLVWLVQSVDWGRVAMVAPSIPALVYAFLLWPFQWVGFAGCALGMPCGG